jgi:hypothetical protein
LRGAALELVAVKMAALVGTDEYRRPCAGIAEAAIGLDRPEAIVNCSFREQIDADMLRSGERLVKETTAGMSACISEVRSSRTGNRGDLDRRQGRLQQQVLHPMVRFERHLKE